jgi:murein L,D-transpeptidase YafK
MDRNHNRDEGLILFENLLFVLLSAILIFPNCAFGIEKADSVIVVKSEAMLYLIKNNEVQNKYKVVFGANPKGHKQKEGDERTPEGSYIFDYKKADSAFYKAIHISYPNENDKKRAREAGVNPGGAIMIHGQKNGLGWLSWLAQHFNWTDGCIAVSNSAMDEIWDSIRVGTPKPIEND